MGAHRRVAFSRLVYRVLKRVGSEREFRHIRHPDLRGLISLAHRRPALVLLGPRLLGELLQELLDGLLLVLNDLLELVDAVLHLALGEAHLFSQGFLAVVHGVDHGAFALEQVLL